MRTRSARFNTIIDPRGKATGLPDNAGNIDRGQSGFLRDWTHRYIALEGGWGAGKTWAGARKLLALHIFNSRKRDVEGRIQITACRSAIISPSYRNAMDYDVPEMERALDESNLDYKWSSGDNAFVIPRLGTGKRPSLIIVRTAEAPERITGWDAGAIWCDEPTRWMENRDDPKRDPLLQATGRLRSPLARLQQFLLTFTNEGDTTRVYEMFHPLSPQHSLYRARTKDNPVVKEFYKSQASILTPDLIRQYLEGEALSLRGVKVYGVFDTAKNVNANLQLDPRLPMQLCLDFNISPGMHAEVGQYFADRDMFTVYKEFHASRMSTRDLMVVFGNWLHEIGWNFPQLEIYGDASGQARWEGTGETNYQILLQGLDVLCEKHKIKMKYVIRVPASNPPVVDRINAFNVAMLDMRGNIHWQCRPECIKLIQDLREMHMDDRGEISKADKMRGHASDAEGYRIHYLRPARIIRQGTAGRFSV